MDSDWSFTPQADTDPVEPQPPPRRKRGAVVVLVGLVLLSAAAVLALVLVPDDSDGTRVGADPQPDADKSPAAVWVVNGTEVSSIGEDGGDLVARIRLEQEPWSFAGVTPPRVVPGSDGALFYSTIENEGATDVLAEAPPTGTPVGTPVVRQFDPATEVDAEVARGAHTLAVGAGDRLAYVRGQEPDFLMNQPYVGDVVVVSDTGEPEVWSPRASSWEVQAWAGDRLVVIEKLGDDERPGAYLLGADGSMVELAGRPVAVRDDGAQILVAKPVDGPLPEIDPATLVLEIIATDTAEAVDHLSAGELAKTSARFVGHYWGDWHGDMIALPAEPGVVLLKVTEAGVEVDGTLPLQSDAVGWTSQTEIVPDADPAVLVLAENNDFDDPGGAVVASIQSCRIGADCIQLADGGGRRQTLSLARNPSSGVSS